MKSVKIYSNYSNDAHLVKKLQTLFPTLSFSYTETDAVDGDLLKEGEAFLLSIEEALPFMRRFEAFGISQKETPIPFYDERVFRALVYNRGDQVFSQLHPLFERPVSILSPVTSVDSLSLGMMRRLQRASTVLCDTAVSSEYEELFSPGCVVLEVNAFNEDVEKSIKEWILRGERLLIMSDQMKILSIVHRVVYSGPKPLSCLDINVDVSSQERDGYRAIIENFGGTFVTSAEEATVIVEEKDCESISSQIYRRAIEEVNQRLGESPSAVNFLKRRKPSLMIQGTCSNAGKSILTSAFGRILFQDGYAVAPFKAQNMALNSFVTRDGLEIGRAQAVQAQACKLIPDVRMNPLLLKPNKDTGSQVVLMGKPVGNLSSREFITDSKMRLFNTISKAYDSLQDEFDVTVIEGAGSPGEVNLKESDIVNMRMARYAQSPVLLAGDIDRGGIYASFLGTYNTFNLFEKELLKGFLINRFRGDASLLKPADDYILNHTGKPVLGTIPFVRDLNIPEEDCFFFDLFQPREKVADILDIAIIGVPHISNFTDFTPLENEPDVTIRPVFRKSELGAPDVIVLPGSKSVIADLQVLRERGLADLIVEKVQSGTTLIGICGGLQMVGETIKDPLAVETDLGGCKGLGLLPLHTVMERGKQLSQTEAKELRGNQKIQGYEIHHGKTRSETESYISQVSTDGRVVGYEKGHIWTSYLHGVFDDDLFRREFINRLRRRKGLSPLDGVQYVYDIESSLNRLADVVRESVDLKEIYRMMGL